GPEPAARLFAVDDREGLLAATLVLVSPREALTWWSGSHPDARPRHAFALLMWSVVEWAAARGIERVCLGAGVGRDPIASFKARLGARTHRYPVRWIDARHAGGLGRLAHRVQRWVRRGRATGAPACGA